MIDVRRLCLLVHRMKTGPGLLFPPLRVAMILTLGLPLLISSGCASKTAEAHKPTHAYPAPHVADAAEIMQRDAQAARTRELVRAGKKPDEARRTAEKEFPAVVSSADTEESAEYYRWKQQQVAQERFEGQLAKMKRTP